MRVGIQTIRPLVLAVLASTVMLIGSIFSPSAATAATYYAATTGSDANPGTESKPFRTVAKLVSVLSAGDTGIVKDGTYNEDYMTVYGSQSGTATNRVTLKAQNKWGAKIVANEGSRCFSKLYLYASYWTVKDLHFTQSAPCSSYTAADNAVLCPYTGSEKGCWLDGNKQDHMTIGFKSNQDNTIFENNVSYDGIEALGTYNSVFRNNTIYLSRPDHNGIVSKGGDRNFQAYGNRIYLTGSGEWGVVLGGASCTTCFRDAASYESYNAVAYNNIILPQGGSVGTGLGMAGCYQCAFYNNTVVGAQTAIRTIANGTSDNIPTVSPTYQNNIFVNNAAAANLTYQGTLTLDYNNFYNTPGAPGQAHAIIGDPRFVSPSTGDVHLQTGSPAIDAGVTLTQVSVDFDALRRPQGAAYDIGACEYGTTKTILAAPATFRVVSQ